MVDERKSIVSLLTREEERPSKSDSTTTTTIPQVQAEDNSKLVMLGLIWSVAVLSALDRVAMSVAILPMSQEYGFTDTVKGSISSLFSVGYGLAILPAGLWIANASPRLVLAGGLALWSLATLATPLATQTMGPLLLVRACVGASESVVLPTIQKLLSAWTEPSEKSAILATVFSGFQTGTILAYLWSPWVMEWAGDDWRGLFYVYGGMGLLFVVPWLALAQDAPEGATPLRNDDDLQGRDLFREAPWQAFAQSKGTWAMLLAHMAKNWGLYNSLAWTPTFYAEQYDIGVRDSALLSVLPSVSAVVGGLIAGNAADKIIQSFEDDISNEQLTTVRKVFQSIAMYGSAITLGILAFHIPDDPVTAQTLLMASVGLTAFNTAGFEAGNQEKSGERWSGLLYSVTSLPAVLFGTLGVYVTGQILDWTGQDWSLVFGINALVNVLGATAFVSLYDSKREFD